MNDALTHSMHFCGEGVSRLVVQVKFRSLCQRSILEVSVISGYFRQFLKS